MSGIMLNFAGVSAASKPDAPTIGTATITGAEPALVSYTAPINNGGSAITLYTATSSPDGITGTLAQSGSGTISVSGLTANTTYTFTVTATNAIGTSVPSAASNSITPSLVPGQAFGGGFYAGQISTTANSVATDYLIVAPLSAGQTITRWKDVNTSTPGADSVINGPQNTADMVADGGSTVYIAAHFCNDLVVGGFSDWYMPAKNELEICYYNLKPSTNVNNTSSGTNINAVPSRGSNYTSGTPAQTSATLFQSGNAQAFSETPYWSSTEFSASSGNMQVFSYGLQSTLYKYNVRRVRAIRRIAV